MAPQKISRFVLKSLAKTRRTKLSASGVSLAENAEVIEAYKWLALADGQGEKQAGELLAKLAKELGPEKISEGKRRVAAFVPKIVFDLEIPE